MSVRRADEQAKESLTLRRPVAGDTLVRHTTAGDGFAVDLFDAPLDLVRRHDAVKGMYQHGVFAASANGVRRG